MTDLRKVSVVYDQPYWLADDPEFELFDFPNLRQLITAVQMSNPLERQIFVIDRKSVEGEADAERQFTEARKHNALIFALQVA